MPPRTIATGSMRRDRRSALLEFVTTTSNRRAACTVVVKDDSGCRLFRRSCGVPASKRRSGGVVIRRRLFDAVLREQIKEVGSPGRSWTTVTARGTQRQSSAGYPDSYPEATGASIAACERSPCSDHRSVHARDRLHDPRRRRAAPGTPEGGRGAARGLTAERLGSSATLSA